MNRTEAKQAVTAGILEKIQELAKMEATNEVTEDASLAESQFAKGLALAKDAEERCHAEVEKIFPE
jgi:hypothetical protein